MLPHHDIPYADGVLNFQIAIIAPLVIDKVRSLFPSTVSVLPNGSATLASGVVDETKGESLVLSSHDGSFTSSRLDILLPPHLQISYTKLYLSLTWFEFMRFSPKQIEVLYLCK